MQTIQITEDSYEAILAAGESVWRERASPHLGDRFYCQPELIAEDKKNLIVEAPKYKLYRYVAGEKDPYLHPGSIIFPENLTKHLPKKQFIALGERIKTIYFDRFEVDTFIEPIIKVDYKFNRDSEGYMLSKERTISWRTEDNRWSDRIQYDVIPITSNQQKLAEIERRRNNIIDEVAGLSRDIGLKSALADLYYRYVTEINLYIKSGSSSLAIAIKNNVDLEWLENPTPSNPNKTVRQFLVEYFSIGTIEPI